MHQLNHSKATSNRFKQFWRKAKLVGLFFLASLGSQDLFAQQKKIQTDTYHLLQDTTTNATIRIHGILKGEATQAWKKLAKATIQIWSEENLKIGGIPNRSARRF